MTSQVLVTESAVPGAVAAAIRQILLIAGGWAVGKGYLDDDTVTAIATIAAIVGPLVYGQVKGWLTHKKLVTVAASPDVPASVAALK